MAQEEPREEPGAGDEVVEPTPAADPSESPATGESAEQPPESAGEAGAGTAGGEDKAEPPAAEAETPPQAEGRPEEPRRGRGQRPRGDAGGGEEEVVPGAHLEPDLVLEEEAERAAREAYGAYEEGAAPEAPAAPAATEPPSPPEQPRPASRTPRDLAADARYQATGKRKTAVARVILRPGEGRYTINDRELAEFFPRETLRLTARQPLEAAGYVKSMDVVARIHGGGVSAQAGALRHGIARALVEADPGLRGELKRRGFLTRDARVKERKKAGLKKARKRPQFSKR